MRDRLLPFFALLVLFAGNARAIRCEHQMINFADDIIRQQNAAAAVDEAASLDRKIQFWQNFGGRTLTRGEAEVSRDVSDISRRLNFDAADTLAKYLRPRYREAYKAYYLYTDIEANIQRIDHLLELAQNPKTAENWENRLKGLVDDEESHFLISRESTSMSDEFRELQDKTRAAFKSGDRKKVLEVLRELKSHGEGLLVEHATVLRRNYEPIRAIELFLIREKWNRSESVADGDSKENFEAVAKKVKEEIKALENQKSGASAEDLIRIENEIEALEVDLKRATKAKTILYRLNPGYVLSDFFEQSGIPRPKDRPSMADFHRIVRVHPEAELEEMRRQRKREKWMTLRNLSPSKFVVKSVIGNSLKGLGVPRQFVDPAVNYLVDENASFRQFSDLQRVIGSDSVNLDSKLLEVELLSNADPKLLEELRLRLDLRPIWNDLKVAANKREDKSFHQKMIEVEQKTAKMSSKDPYTHRRRAQVINRLLDVAFVYGLWWGVPQLWESLFGDDEPEDHLEN